MSDLRHELAEVIESAVDEDLPADPTRAELQAACLRAADALLPIITRETAAAHQRGLLDGVMIERRALTDDLRERMERARKRLGDSLEERRHLHELVDRMDIARLAGKASGVSLCIDYLRAYEGES